MRFIVHLGSTRAIKHIALAAGLSVLIVGCNKSEKDTKTAAGVELLPRSVSDDMLPYDTVKSQASLSAPPATPAEGDRPASTRGTSRSSDTAATTEGATAPTESSAPAPTASPAPTPAEPAQ